MNFRLVLSLILVVSDFVASDLFYDLNPLGPVCSRFATKWDYINEHFVVVVAAWAIIGFATSFLASPMWWQGLSRSDAMIPGFFYAGLIGLAVDIGGSAYQRWVATVDMSVHTWTRWGLIVNAGLRTLLWLVIFTFLSIAFVAWKKRHEADFIE